MMAPTFSTWFIKILNINKMIPTFFNISNLISNAFMKDTRYLFKKLVIKDCQLQCHNCFQNLQMSNIYNTRWKINIRNRHGRKTISENISANERIFCLWAKKSTAVSSIILFTDRSLTLTMFVACDTSYSTRKTSSQLVETWKMVMLKHGFLNLSLNIMIGFLNMVLHERCNCKSMVLVENKGIN